MNSRHNVNIKRDKVKAPVNSFAEGLGYNTLYLYPISDLDIKSYSLNTKKIIIGDRFSCVAYKILIDFQINKNTHFYTRIYRLLCEWHIIYYN